MVMKDSESSRLPLVLVLLYRGHVQDCTFHDALPSSGGGPITVNYGLNTTWEGNVFTPQGGRLVPLKVA